MPLHSRPWPLADENRRLALMLTGVAGFVDALGFLTLANIYVANMSGNSVGLGMDGGGWDWPQLLHRALAVGAFVAGLLVSNIMIESTRRLGIRRVLALSLWLEIACLAWFMWAAWARFGAIAAPSAPHGLATLIGLLAFAMGAQNASLRSSGALNVYTTHVTGTLTTMAQSAVEYVFWIVDHHRAGELPASLKHESLGKTLLMLGLWICYVAGACVGTVGWRRWGIAAMGVPLAILLYISVSETLRPRQVRQISV
jgi:uncharacterized membrane protein YoaK (UPF0700 family)